MAAAATVILAVVLVVGVGVTVYRSMRREERSDQIPAIAAQHGLELTDLDSFGLTSIGFPLLHEGDGRQVEHIMWQKGADDADEADRGRRLGPSRVFDYGYYRIHHDRTGQEYQSWRWFSCAMAEHDGQWPPIRIEHRGLVDAALEKVGDGAIHFESDEFNQTFHVTCDDRRFASALIDPQMMQFLLETKGVVAFETRGRFLLVSTEQVPADEMPILLGLADEFVRRIPGAVWQLYPKFAPRSAPDPVVALSGADADGGDGAAVDPDAAWDPTPGVDYDLDGHPVVTEPEDPWHDHPLRPHDQRPPDRQWTDDTT